MVRISRRLIFITLGSIIGLAILAIAALVIAALAIDPERLKPRIQAQFQERTGRTLTLDGDLSWRFFPWIVIRSGGGAIGHPQGFDAGTEFARWKTLRLGVELLPLFDREVIVDSIEIDGLELNLTKLVDGRVSWELPAEAGALALDGEEASGEKSPRLQFAVAFVNLTDARLRWRDETLKQDWRTEQLAVRLRIPGRATAQAVGLRDIAVKGRLAGTPFPNIVDVVFESQRLDFEAENLRVRLPAWKAAFAGAALEGSLDTRLGGEDRRVDGRIAAHVESLREVLRAVGIELPRTRDREVFGQAEIETQFALDEGRIATESLQLRIDDTRLRGRIEREPIEDGVIRFALIGDTIDVDRYLLPVNVKSEPFELKLAPLKALKADGELAFTEARMGGAVMKGLKVNVR